MNYYTGSVQHLLAELERIDLLIRVQVMQARQLHQRDSEFQGLYIPEAEVDELLSSPPECRTGPLPPSPSSQPDIRTALDGTEQKSTTANPRVDSGVSPCVWTRFAVSST